MNPMKISILTVQMSFLYYFCSLSAEEVKVITEIFHCHIFNNVMLSVYSDGSSTSNRTSSYLTARVCLHTMLDLQAVSKNRLAVKTSYSVHCELHHRTLNYCSHPNRTIFISFGYISWMASDCTNTVVSLSYAIIPKSTFCVCSPHLVLPCTILAVLDSMTLCPLARQLFHCSNRCLDSSM